MKLDLDRYIPGLLLWVSNKVSSGASQLYRTRFDIGITDWRVLSYFMVYPWSTATKACELMGLDKAAVSRSIALLVGRGLLDARPDGLRKVEYYPSAEGRKLHDRIFKIAIEREEALLTGFTGRERDVLVEMLHRLLHNLPAVNQPGEETIRHLPAATPGRRRSTAE